MLARNVEKPWGSALSMCAWEMFETQGVLRAAISRYTGGVDREQRAQRRRQQWAGGVIRAGDDALRADLAFWREATPEQRLQAVTELVHEAWSLEHPDEPFPRLDRSVGGVRRRER